MKSTRLVPEDLVRFWPIITGSASRCDAIYLQAHLVEQSDAFAGLAVNVFRSRRTVVSVAFNETECFITCRGTDPGNSQAVMNDLNWSFIEEPCGGKVPIGVKQEVGHVWAAVFDFVKRNVGDRKIYCSGHSLGGAMAELIYARLGRWALRNNELHRMPYGLITWCKPKSADHVMAAWVNMIADIHRQQDRDSMGHVRFAFATDFVSGLPLGILPRYRDHMHSGVYFHIFRNGECRRQPWPWRLWLGWLGARFSRHCLTAGGRDHKLSNCVDAVGKMEIATL